MILRQKLTELLRHGIFSHRWEMVPGLGYHIASDRYQCGCFVNDDSCSDVTVPGSA